MDSPVIFSHFMLPSGHIMITIIRYCRWITLQNMFVTLFWIYSHLLVVLNFLFWEWHVRFLKDSCISYFQPSWCWYSCYLLIIWKFDCWCVIDNIMWSRILNYFGHEFRDLLRMYSTSLWQMYRLACD